MNEAQAESAALEHGRRFLLACYDGILHIDGPDSTAPVKFIRDPADGRIIMACPVATFFAEEIVLFTPDEADDAMKLLLSAEQIEECHLTDRVLAYHGEPEHVRWGAFWIDSAKHGPWVFDGDAMMIPSALADAERELLKELNADTPRLSALVQRAREVEVASPVALGIDQLGLDIRARFGPMRIAFEHECPDNDAARTEIERILRS